MRVPACTRRKKNEPKLMNSRGTARRDRMLETTVKPVRITAVHHAQACIRQRPMPTASPTPAKAIKISPIKKKTMNAVPSPRREDAVAPRPNRARPPSARSPAVIHQRIATIERPTGR
jgi:hypothetical protein